MKGKRDLLKPGRVSVVHPLLFSVTLSKHRCEEAWILNRVHRSVFGDQNSFTDAVFFPPTVCCFVWQMFVKEGTLMKVSKKSRQPRHLFLVNCLIYITFKLYICRKQIKMLLYLFFSPLPFESTNPYLCGKLNEMLCSHICLVQTSCPLLYYTQDIHLP